MSKHSLLSLCLLCWLLLCSCVQAQFWSGPQDNKPSAAVREAPVVSPLQPQLDRAAPGATLAIDPGVYVGELTVSKPVRLVPRGQGKEAVILDAGHRGSAVVIRSSDVMLENLTIRHYGADLYARDAGVRVESGAHRVRLQGLRLQGPGFGVRADHVQDLSVRRCSISGDRAMHVLDRGDGVFLKYVEHPDLADNTVRNVRDGFYFENVKSSRSTDNDFSGLQYGIHYMYTEGDAASGNLARGVRGGYALMSSRAIDLRGNRVAGAVEFGILLNVCDGCRVTENQAGDVFNPRGRVELDTEGKALFIYGPGKNTVVSNRFYHSDIGVGVALGGESNGLWNNSFENNHWQVRYVGTKPVQWSAERRGNYWSDYQGWDLNGDGIGDTAYRPNDALDRLFWIYPEIRFLMDSPVVVLLRWIAQRLGIDADRGVQDNFPLMTPPRDRAADRSAQSAKESD